MNGNFKAVGSKGVDDDEDYSVGIQIINENKDFTTNLPEYLSHHNLLASGFNYHIVAVFGSQSTGKSTLLNHLFKTHFSVMNEAARKQTTKGIWMAKAQGGEGSGPRMADNVLVMDVEGTDGRERGEDQDFERKSALFALATSEVLIVNIWEHQVGLYHGANMGLLKTVFEVNLQLFQKSSNQRSLLFFVIRDYQEKAPLDSLAGLLMSDLNKIWSTLSKPAGLENSAITDFFDFEFAALPHKIFREENFVLETSKLSTRFREVESEEELANTEKTVGGDGAIFRPAYHRRIPADGFPHYAAGIWEQIVTNKDLDLPSQQELLAQYRCEEISAVVTREIFDPTVIPLEEKGSGTAKVLSGLGSKITHARKETLAAFSVEAGRYFKPVYLKKHAELESKLDARLKALVLLHFQGLHKRSVSDFEDAVGAFLKKSATSSTAAETDFRAVVESAKQEALDNFLEEAKPCRIEGCSWSDFDDELLQTTADIDIVAARMRGEEIRRLRVRIERAIRSKLAEPIEVEFRKLAGASSVENRKEGEESELQLWDGVWAAFEKVTTEGVKRFLEKAEALNASQEENEVASWMLRRKAWGLLRAKLEEELMEGNILLKLRENFEDHFRYDPNGVPRVWKPSDDIETLYASARETTLKLIPLISEFKLSTTGAPPPLHAFIGERPKAYIPSEEDDVDEDESSSNEFLLLSDARRLSLTTRFRKTADSIFLEAKRSTISSIASIPPWIYLAMLVLGWNELWAVISSPLYFVFLVMALGGLYVVHTLNLYGPMMRVSNAMLTQASEVAKERLREFLDSTKAPSQREAVALPGREDVELKDLKRNGGRSPGREEGEEEW